MTSAFLHNAKLAGSLMSLFHQFQKCSRETEWRRRETDRAKERRTTWESILLYNSPAFRVRMCLFRVCVCVCSLYRRAGVEASLMWLLCPLRHTLNAVHLLQGLRCVLSLPVPLGTFNRYASQSELNCSCKLLTKQPCPGFCIQGKINYLTPPPLHFTAHFQHAGANYTQQKDYSLCHFQDDLHLAAPHHELLVHQLQALMPRWSVLMHWLLTL